MPDVSARLRTRPRLAAAALLSFALVLGLTVAGGALLSLAERPDGSTGIDRSITTWALEHRDHALTTVARVLSTIGSQTVLLPLTGLVALGLVLRRRFAAAGALVLVWAGAVGLYNPSKQIVERPRPPTVLWLTHAGGFSFPSGHATQSLATYAALLLVALVWLPRLRLPGWAIIFVLVAGIGWSRVYLGVHWATDVLVGWCAAAAWLALVVWLRRTAAVTAAADRSPRGSPGPRQRT